ncbi:N-formylglutamate amidohydrolase [Leptospira ilyithenensis]|uniref:N-formylglutamate amidohydrolase n=1 Tax=Leptospira ilyithenensis TaxID=2484901 RepID=A0A4R9LM19_9LEPT|nr:N-formylglutamate amidohydrolase [Leptospira ilyithenensis]TGN09358.1 N-formylglutamate amidohydrolase [Leptospira ilyithenensis]
MKVLLTCEHARNSFPPDMENIFKGKQRLLQSHRGWDEGALEMARGLKRKLKAPLLEGSHSRLVIDLNRSINHRKAFSEITKRLPQETKDKIISTIHRPFRENARVIVEKQSQVLHLSIHSFVPILDGKKRNCEIGILYDPRRPLETNVAKQLKLSFQANDPNVIIKMNYPYRGTSDGHTTQLRRTFSPKKYLGIELEFNQAWLKKLKNKNRVIEWIADSIQNSLL